jgi:putative ABC transport system substrate-binding protein
MRRRDFILGIAGSAAAWPLAALAQRGVRRIGILLNLSVDDPESRHRLSAFTQALEKLGWKDGQNVRIDIRSGIGNVEFYRKYAAELVAECPGRC